MGSGAEEMRKFSHDRTPLKYELLSLPLPNILGKVKLPLCLTKHHTMKTYWGVEV
jgi:hypothetical protein